MIVGGSKDLTQRQCRNILIYGYGRLLIVRRDLNLCTGPVNSKTKAVFIIILRYAARFDLSVVLQHQYSRQMPRIYLRALLS